MKKLFLIVSLLAMMMVTGAVVAAPVNVNFSSLVTSFNITLPLTYNLDGITFSYDNFATASETAAINPQGIAGSTYGALIFDFAAPATALNFNFTLNGAAGNPADALTAIFDNGDSATIPDGVGALAYTGAPFSNAQFFFAVNAAGAPLQFTVSNLSYEPVPEPGSMVALISIIPTCLVALKRKRS